MTDNELLLAISKILDPVREDIQGLKDDIQEFKIDVQGLKTDVRELKGDVELLKGDVQELKGDVALLKGDVQELKGDVALLKGDVQELKGDVQELKGDVQELKERVRKIELTQENLILPRLNTIESCYTSTYNRYKDSVETYEAMKQDISVIKKVVAEHSDKLQKIS